MNFKLNKISFLFRLLLIATILLLYSTRVNAQSDSTKKIIAKYDTLPVVLKEGEIISKTLVVLNRTDKALTFSADVSVPAGWRSLTNRSRLFTLNQGDSIFVPIRIIPIGKLRGNTKYLINTYILDKDSTPVTMASFYARRDKVSNWDVYSDIAERVYFKNNSFEAKFSAGVLNTGNEDLDVLMEVNHFRKDFSITDTSGLIIKKPLYEFHLKPGDDTTMRFGVKGSGSLRHFKFIDTETHRPNSLNEPQKYSIYIKTSEPKLKGSSRLQKTKKIDFVRLSDRYEVNPFGYSALPVTMDANVYNIIGGQPLMNLSFRGNSVLSNGASVNFFTQSFFSTPYYSNQYLQSGVFYAGYFMPTWGVEVGQVGFGPAGGGTGVSGNYSISPSLKLRAFINTGPSLFRKREFVSGGLNAQYNNNLFNVNAFYVHRSDFIQKLETDYFSINGSFHLNQSQTISAGTITQYNNSNLSTNRFQRLGSQITLGYNGNFMIQNKNRLSVTLNGSYLTKYFTPFNAGEGYLMFHTSNYQLKKSWSLSLSNSYNKREFIPVLTAGTRNTTTSFTNIFSASRRIDDNYASAGAFYFINGIDNNYVHSRGINFGFGKYNYENNQLISTNIMAGYTRAIYITPTKDYFFLQFNTLMRYRVLSMNFRYTYGTMAGVNNSQFSPSGIYPQSISLSANYQYQFRDPHFILQNQFIYSYKNTTSTHGFTYFPQLYYYTNNGWRFLLAVTMFVSKNTAEESISDVYNFHGSTSDSQQEQQTLFGNLNVALGVRKQFGIPLPMSKQKFFSTDFVAFIDLNGNGKKDPGEFTLENIVVKMDKYEVLTNERGRCSIKNVPMNTYRLDVFSLEDVEGYFPNTPDTIQLEKQRTGDSAYAIPFVKGIKIFGKIVVSRDKVSERTGNKIDVSDIKISAINGKTINSLTERDGSFNFYVPYGHYKLHMDERVLGEQFTLLQNDIELNLDRKTENLFVTFYVIEKRKRIVRKKVGPDGKIIDDIASAETINNNSGSTDSAEPPKYLSGEKDIQAGTDQLKAARQLFLSKTRDVSSVQGLIYTIQLGSFQKPLNPSVFSGLTNLLSEQLDNNFIRIAAGRLNSWAEAQAELINIQKVGFTDAYINAYYNGKQISVQEAQKIQNAK